MKGGDIDAGKRSEIKVVDAMLLLAMVLRKGIVLAGK